jgi:hypothetical protein
MRTIHQGEQAFACSVCDKSFGQANNLRRHEEIMHKSMHSGEDDTVRAVARMADAACRTETVAHDVTLDPDHIEIDAAVNATHVHTLRYFVGSVH